MAHKCVLSLQCRELYEISNQGDNTSGNGNPTPIPIDSVRGEVFKSLLDYVYTVKEPDMEDEETMVELLVAADLFGCVDLKLLVEFFLVDKFMSAERAAALFLLGDSLSCALLKEAASDVIVENPDIAKKAREDWSKIEESNRLLEELQTKNHSVPDDSASTVVDEMTVIALRLELEEEDLELDGSREVLVERLKSFRKHGPTLEK